MKESCHKCNTILGLAEGYNSDVRCPSCGVSYSRINGCLYPLDDHMSGWGTETQNMKGFKNVYKSGGGKPGRNPPLPEYLSPGGDDDYFQISEYKFSDGWVYFEHFYETSAEYVDFYKMRVDGNDLENYFSRILSDDLSCEVTAVKDGWVYFTITHDHWESENKVRTDGSDVTEITSRTRF